MKANKVASVEDHKIVTSFQSLRKTLLEAKYNDRLEKPLAYWAMPNDRRLPLAFLGRTIKDLLATPFEELSATPGIGQKKISSLVKLLTRATKDQPPAVPFGITELGEKKVTVEKPRRPGGRFDASVVSESLWTQWRSTIRRLDLGNIKLGRVAPTLQALPTVIWHTPLGNYVDYTVAEIRQLKTHGEKRVRVVLEVFCILHEMLSQAQDESYLRLRLTPKFTESLEAWVAEALDGPGVPTPSEIRDSLAAPLLDQVLIDAGATIHALGQGRLGIIGAPESVRHQAKRMGVTRARIYQLLEDCSKVMRVRWPEGQYMLGALAAKCNADADEKDDLRLFRATMELFYPGKNRIVEDDND